MLGYLLLAYVILSYPIYYSYVIYDILKTHTKYKLGIPNYVVSLKSEEIGALLLGMLSPIGLLILLGCMSGDIFSFIVDKVTTKIANFLSTKKEEV